MNTVAPDEDASPPRLHPAVCALVLAGVAVRVWCAGTWPLPRLISSFVGDDAMYYAEIARHIWEGRGATFDGEILTNGFHPLWMAVCVGIQAMAGPDPERVLRVMLAVLTGVSALYAWLLARIGARMIAPGKPIAVLFILLAWAFNPYWVGTDLNGVEAPLALAGALAATDRYFAWRHALNPRRVAVIGVMLGFTFLGRTDGGVLGLVTAVALVVDAVRSGEGWIKGLARATGAGIAALVVASPWFAWSLARFGTIWQDSGVVLVFRQHSLAADAAIPFWTRLIQLGSRGVFDCGLRLTGGAHALATLAFILLAALWCRWFRRRYGVPAGRWPVAFVAFATINWAFYTFYFQQHKYWYHLPVHVVFAFGFARLAAYVSTLPKRGGAVLAVLALFALAQYQLNARRGFFDGGGFYPWQRDYLSIGRELAAGRPEGITPDDTIGGFNAGIIGAFSRRRVVNLDGVVNPHIITAMRQERFGSYLRDASIDVIVDHADLIKTYARWSQNGAMPHFQVIHQFTGGSGPSGNLVAVRLSYGDEP